jgi:hypothetical protein
MNFMVDNMHEDLKVIVSAQDLSGLDQQLTDLMKGQKLLSLVKDENLLHVVDAVLKLVSGGSRDKELYAAAILGRLASVVRGREKEVFTRASSLFTAEPQSIDTLADGDQKGYAARFLANIEASWLTSYCSRESLAIDTANNARRELLRTLVARCDNLSNVFQSLVDEKSALSPIKQIDTKVKRIRRILECLVEVVREFEGDIGSNPGIALSGLFDNLLSGLKNSDVEALYSCFDSVISILVRTIELRFSHALHAETYQVLQVGRRIFSQTIWGKYLKQSNAIAKIQLNLLETILVLSRQNRTDKEILRVMEASWPSTYLMSKAIEKHFKGALDLNPEVSGYWLKLGRISTSGRASEHKVGSTEDQQIGELIIQFEANRINMNKLNQDVVPVLETFDPHQAATVRRAANGYESIAQIAERLARMRKLSKTDLLEEVVEYNPVGHDMEGGHQAGIRTVKVVRDGIIKDFGGKKKILVKPRVEAEE